MNKSLEPVEVDKSSKGAIYWTPKRFIATAAGILALLGGGTGVYGLGTSAAAWKDEVDKVQSKQIERIYDKVVENGKNIAVLLERTRPR